MVAGCLGRYKSLEVLDRIPLCTRNPSATPIDADGFDMTSAPVDPNPMAAARGFADRHRWPLGLAIAAALGAAYLVMREADALLLMLESAGEQRYGMGALTDLHSDGETARRALVFWARSGGRPFAWVQVHAIADSVFALAYTLVFAVALRRLIRAGFLGRRARAQLAGYATVGLLLVADLAENLLIWLAAHLSQNQIGRPVPFQSTAVADHVFWVGIIKWAAFGAVLALLAVGLADVHFGIDDPARKDTPSWRRVLWRLRIQVSVVAVMAFLVAVPSNDRLGALQQLPDVLRSYLTGSARPLPVLLGTVAPGFLGAAVWISAHWLPYGSPESTSAGWRWPYHVVAGFTMLWALLFVLQRWAPVVLSPLDVVPVPPWASPFQVALPSLVGALLLGAAWWLHHKYGRRSEAPPCRPWHARYARTINLLAVAPVLIAGLGLVRAAAGLALLPGAAGRGVLGIALGTVVALVLAPLVLLLLSHRGRTELATGPAEPATGQVEPATRPAEPIAVPAIANTIMIGVTVLAIAVLAAWPVRLGPQVGVLSILVVALTAATLGLGGLVAVGLRAQAFAVNLVSNTERRPVALPTVLLFLGVIAVVNVTDSADTYHEVRYRPATSLPANRSLAGHFTAWQQAVQDCGAPNAPGDRPRLQPLVFVAAAGGGIRAAYWTEEALLQMTGIEPGTSPGPADARCRRDSVFLISAVSGGSVGAALWSARPTGAERTAAPYAKAIAGEEALSAVGATWLFRDGARAMTGLDFGWPDRAAAMEQAWNERLAAGGVDLNRPFLPTDSTWRSLLLLNGTDLQTGCRLVIGPVVPDAIDELPRNCQEVSGPGADLPATYYLPEFLDTSKCDTGREHTLSTTSAALLSARFPFITPTGLLYACSADRRSAVQVQIGDGGYLEASGIQAALQSWRALEPIVAQHNREVLDTDPQQPTLLGNALIVPVFVVIGNSYRSVAAAGAPEPEGELLAPLAGAGAAKAGIAPSRLEAEMRAALSRPIPGSNTAVTGFEVRVVVLTPTSRPEITAPLGWALSAATQQTLDQQMAAQAAENRELRILRGLMSGGTPVGPMTTTTQPP